MSKVLVVDDSPLDRQLAGRLLAKDTDLSVVYAANGREALAAIPLEHPDVVLTDLNMPELDGLGLVLEVRAKHPFIPVVLMTASGSEDVAVEALERGAASYVPKRNLARDLVETVTSVLEAALTKQGRQRLMECLTRTESHFVLDNDPGLVGPLVEHLKDNLYRIYGSDDTGLMRVNLALREAVLNAMEHGNLELQSALKEEDFDAYYKLAAERRKQSPYKDRRVHVVARESPKEAVYIISDDGAGFDTSQMPDPHDPENMTRSSGRGLLLIRTFMTEVHHNPKGNEITMILRPDHDGGI